MRAVHLDRAVDDGVDHLRHLHLDLRDLLASGLLPDSVDLPRGVQHRQARRVDLDPRARDPVLHELLVGERLAARNARVRAPAHQLERALGGADRSHAVMDAPGPKRACAIANPSPRPPSTFAAGKRTPWKRSSAWP